jgi:hypothetical protein
MALASMTTLERILSDDDAVTLCLSRRGDQYHAALIHKRTSAGKKWPAGSGSTPDAAIWALNVEVGGGGGLPG